MFRANQNIFFDIQPYDAKRIKNQLEKFIHSNSDKESIDIKISSPDRNMSTSILMSRLGLDRQYLYHFFEEYKLLEADKVLTSESSIEDLLGVNDQYQEYLFACTLDFSILLLHLLNLADKEEDVDEIPDESWTPPENWSHGTDDEKEAYKTFWGNQK
jgi:hypothetical protein